ncbi:caspase domain-containing protein [Lentinula boryana]|uniref:Caspase domain-containing protein n=1 Tax=Lentinula boryana TaxID=40481 RepID=A0ABQ8QGT5_9AGAR|nr:caspase domain-containing protein [Lentinula boryana]
MMWDIGKSSNHEHSNRESAVVRMPSPVIGSNPIIYTPAPSQHSGHLAVPMGEFHSYAGSRAEPTTGVPLARAISADEPRHLHQRHYSNPPDVDRALHLPAIIVKSSHHHHKSHHKHSHSADNTHQHQSHAPRYETSDSGHHQYSLTPRPRTPMHYDPQQQQYRPTKPLIAHPPHPGFLYSLCNRRRKALCIGINYLGEPHELKGCINDARSMRKFLIEKHGYKREDIVLLTDDSRDPRSQPNRRNMIAAMQWLVQSAHCHDSLFFHYSGHGGQTKDYDGDEVDGMDEVIFPVDFKRKGHIVDDDLYKIMVAPLPAGCRLTALFDSCHSGTVLDLPFIYTPRSRIRGSHVSQRARARRSSPADVISFSACKDGQKSTDTFKGGVAVGAMSWAYCEVMSRHPDQSYKQILRAVNDMTYPRYHQTPQLGSSHHIDMNRKFIV